MLAVFNHDWITLQSFLLASWIKQKDYQWLIQSECIQFTLFTSQKREVSLCFPIAYEQYWCTKFARLWLCLLISLTHTICFGWAIVASGANEGSPGKIEFEEEVRNSQVHSFHNSKYRCSYLDWHFRLLFPFLLCNQSHAITIFFFWLCSPLSMLCLDTTVRLHNCISEPA